MATPLLPGFMGLGDVLNARVTDENVPVVDRAIQQTLTVHEENTRAMLATFVQQTTEYKFKYSAALGNGYLMGKDHIGRTRGFKGLASYEIGLPIHEAGIAFGYDQRARIKSTVRDINNRMAYILDADRSWQRNNIFAALFANVDYTFEDQEHGTLVVKPLANGDSQVYDVLPGATDGTTANNFAAQSNAIDDAHNPFPTIYDTLSNRPENGVGDVIVFVPNNLVSAIQSLTAFLSEQDPNIRPAITSALLVGTVTPRLPGKVIGYVNRCWIVEWKSLPSNYMIAIHTGGDKPVAMRVPVEPELQGFRAEGERNDHPYTERYYAREAGFGVLNRLGAMVYRIGNASYAIPTNFTRADVIG